MQVGSFSWVSVPEPSQGKFLPLHVLHCHMGVHWSASVTPHTSSGPGAAEIMVMALHGPGLCGGNLCRIFLMYTEEEELTGVVRDSPQR